MHMKNLPTEAASSLAGLIDARAHQVASKSLVDADSFSMMLMAFDTAESVSEERYPGDVLYLVLEGRLEVVLPERRVALVSGQVLMVPGGVLHALEAPDAVKLMQVGLSES